jgi:putative Ca2+/H+ antiporter (TMEM165/GDT1 family)
MDLRLFATVFASIFVAELGDKTQLAALVLTSAIGVLAGGFVSEHVSERVLHWIAGAGFVAIGVWILVRG